MEETFASLSKVVIFCVCATGKSENMYIEIKRIRQREKRCEHCQRNGGNFWRRSICIHRRLFVV